MLRMTAACTQVTDVDSAFISVYTAKSSNMLNILK